jgi:hypothetical protein
MKKCVNGKMVEITPEEVAELRKAQQLAEAAERTRPMTVAEVAELLIPAQINSLAVDDNTALRMLNFYPAWASGVSYAAGYKVQHNGKLWRVLQTHTAQTGWEPENAASLWAQINETHSGEVDDPIPYDGNMALEEGKYYIQEGVIYRCIRDTENPVYSPLAQLVGTYVEEEKI